MSGSDFPYFALIPVLVFGPVVGWMLYNFGLKELFKVPAEMRARRRAEAAAAAEQAVERSRKRQHAGATHGRRPTAAALAGQAAAYLPFVAVLGLFSAWPGYTHVDPGDAVVKLSLSHPGQRKVECRQRSREELAKLAPNMRAQQACPRERWPVTVELEMDGRILHRRTAAPAGLSSDGAASVYARFAVPAGRHRVTLRLADGGAGFNHERTAEVTLDAARVLVVGFQPQAGGIVIR